MLSINLNLSKVGPSVGLRTLRGNQVKNLIQGIIPVNMIAELTGVFQSTLGSSCYSPIAPTQQTPLGIWTNKVAELTGLSAQEDLASAYTALMNHLNTNQFNGELKSDSSLWIREDPKMMSEQFSTDTDIMLEEELEQ